MALREYRDGDGHTFLYDESDKLRPKALELVTTKPASESDADREAAAKAAADAHKAAATKTNKAAPAGSENK